MYEIYLLDPLKNRLALLDHLENLTYVRGLNQPGSWSLTLPDELSSILLRPDNLIEIWRQNSLGHMKFEMMGFMRRPKFSTQGGRALVTLSGPGLLYLLAGRVVAYAAGSAEAAKSDQADDMIKAIIRENLGASAVAARDWTAQGLTVQADQSLAPSITKRFARREVAVVCQEIAAESFQRGTPLYYDLIPSWAGDVLSFEFRTYINQRGADHTYTSAFPVVFGENFGNLDNPELEYDYWDEVTDVYAGGQGEAADRLISEQSDAARLGRSIWNRRERFVNATNEQTATELESAARAALDAGKPKVRFTGDLLSVPGSEYGVDWEFGDKVTGTYHDQQFDGWIDKLQITLSPSGEENIKTRLEVEA